MRRISRQAVWGCLALSWALIETTATWEYAQAGNGGYVNYYAQGEVPAQLYVSPRPVPERVGHTVITYPPLAPHEFLYRHRRVYYRTHEDGNMTKTTVRWCWNPFHQYLGSGPRVPSNPYRGWHTHDWWHVGMWGVW